MFYFQIVKLMINVYQVPTVPVKQFSRVHKLGDVCLFGIRAHIDNSNQTWYPTMASLIRVIVVRRT